MSIKGRAQMPYYVANDWASPSMSEGFAKKKKVVIVNSPRTFLFFWWIVVWTLPRTLDLQPIGLTYIGVML